MYTNIGLDLSEKRGCAPTLPFELEEMVINPWMECSTLFSDKSIGFCQTFHVDGRRGLSFGLRNMEKESAKHAPDKDPRTHHFRLVNHSQPESSNTVEPLGRMDFGSKLRDHAVFELLQPLSGLQSIRCGVAEEQRLSLG